MDMTPVPDLMPALPEIILAIGALILLMVGAFRGEQSTSVVTGMSVALLVFVAGIAAFVAPAGVTFSGSFALEDFSRFLKVLIALASAVAIAMTVAYARAERFERFEFPVLIVLGTLGMFIMVSANDLIALYLGFELQSLALYVVATINRDSGRSTEAGLKYFVLGALSSGMLLYGSSLVYGFTGHVDFPGISAALDGGVSTGLVFGLVFVITGLAFKVSAVPFHMWTPDVYEGAPTPVTAFFAAAPKVAAMGLFVRVMFEAFPVATEEWQQIVAFIAVASMLLGSFAAIGQRNIKRLMAYSSIGHVGFALVGLAAGTEMGVRGVLIYLVTYVAMTLGAFAVILSMRREEGMVEDVYELSGLARTNPTMGFLLAMIMFSLIGIPPFAGFFGKYFTFLAAVESGLYWLAVIGFVASTIGAYYYLRVVKIIFFDEPREGFQPMPVELKVVLGAASVVVILFAFIAGPIDQAAAAAAASLF